MKPHVIMLMETSLDGRLHPSRWSESPDGTRRDWSAAYEAMHETLAGDAWIIGRVTMAEMTKADSHPAAAPHAPPRPVHVGRRDAKPYAVALDSSGKLHFSGPAVNGDHAIVLLGAGVSDSHLAELAADGVSYIVAEGSPNRPCRCAGCARPRLRRAPAAARGRRRDQRLLPRRWIGGRGASSGRSAFDGGADVQGIVALDGGLAGKVNLSLRGAEAIEHGLVHLSYAVMHDLRVQR